MLERVGPEKAERIRVRGQTWLLTPHATARRKERNILLKHVKATIEEPDRSRRSRKKRKVLARRIGERTFKVITQERKNF